MLVLWNTDLTKQNEVHAVDITPPNTTHTLDPPHPNGTYGWYTQPVTVKLDATDLESGVASINYRIDRGAWQTVTYNDTLNLVTNPSFETYDMDSNIHTQAWESTIADNETNIIRDTTTYPTGFGNTSIKITTTGTTWHGINNATTFASATPYANMSASAWLKTSGVTQTAYFKIYSVSMDQANNPIYTLIAQSGSITADTEWTKVYVNFIVTDPNAIGVYMDIGLDGPGTLWIDAVTISDSVTSQSTSFIVGADSANHIVEYYSTDKAGNTEGYDCTHNINCIRFKIDQTPPGQWHDAGAFRGWFGRPYQLWVYTNVIDDTSGLSVFTDKYQIKTELNPTWGMYSNFLSCWSTWIPNAWLFLITPPFTPGIHSAYLITPKTSFCNTNWNNCKYVRFYAQDMAGNTTTKEYCINGPWVRLRGEGIVRANGGIDMVAEARGDNTDGLVEIGNNTMDFFTTSKDWIVKEAPTVQTPTYQELWDKVQSKTPTHITNIQTGNGIFYTTGNLTISSLPSGYTSNTFTQVIFVDGDLTINTNISTINDTAVLFVVSGNINIDKNVQRLYIGILADGDIYTAYNLAEGDPSDAITFHGIYKANKIVFQRTLQGTNNTSIPSEDFVYEPKFVLKMKDYFGQGETKWNSID